MDKRLQGALVGILVGVIATIIGGLILKRFDAKAELVCELYRGTNNVPKSVDEMLTYTAATCKLHIKNNEPEKVKKMFFNSVIEIDETTDFIRICRAPRSYVKGYISNQGDIKAEDLRLTFKHYLDTDVEVTYPDETKKVFKDAKIIEIKDLLPSQSLEFTAWNYYDVIDVYHRDDYCKVLHSTGKGKNIYPKEITLFNALLYKSLAYALMGIVCVFIMVIIGLIWSRLKIVRA